MYMNGVMTDIINIILRKKQIRLERNPHLLVSSVAAVSLMVSGIAVCLIEIIVFQMVGIVTSACA